ncbi:BON domain-containing protein [Pseudomonas typographi]|uniref:BON domain-containing protein n=1 Tax=Pseudomonas typographi TaxID=2715964 RepID=UPI0016836606|nr:BON domain-containing protein [Pseudomonas typographi]MBD1588342.1 BON domain-containing protein [Pseudomonas typographi]
MPVLKPAALVLFAAALFQANVFAAPTADQAARDEGAIWMAMALNQRLSPYTLKVEVQGAHAVLSGKVENQQDKDLAESIAKTVGQLAQVDNQLQIDAALGDLPPTRQPVAQRIDDATLTATVRAKLSWNAPTQGSDMTVSTDGGVVTLKGHAQTAEAKLLAGTLAHNTDGVYVVNNLISLSAADTQTARAEAQANAVDNSVTDAWITSKVKASFLYDRNLDALTIDVATREGMVSLVGEVVSSEQKTHAVEIARTLRGVRGVDADLLKVALGGAR